MYLVGIGMRSWMAPTVKIIICDVFRICKLCDVDIGGAFMNTGRPFRADFLSRNVHIVDLLYMFCSILRWRFFMYWLTGSSSLLGSLEIYHKIVIGNCTGKYYHGKHDTSCTMITAMQRILNCQLLHNCPTQAVILQEICAWRQFLHIVHLHSENLIKWTLTLLHVMKIELELCQIFERHTQILLISGTIKTEAKKAHQPGVRSPCRAVGHRWAASVWSCSSGMWN